MSDSRLEKFIYAICSMDVSDLPVPLSRIEKLWNCLIKGETPDFEPLSRNEKYLMAMLDRYDISNLPAPTSRGEKLLYKIAVGETDLSDVPGYLSRYEELLKYLIENGGISGGDFKYVLYTLNQSLSTLYSTAEKPVKSAILSGQTLVNILGDYPEQTFTLDNTWQQRNIPIEYTNLIKPNTTYTFVFNVTECQMANSTNGNFQIGDDKVFNDMVNLKLKLGVNTYKLTTQDSISFPMRLYGSAHNSGTLTFNLMLLEGDYVGQNIPHFNGMQSVKLPVLTTSNEDDTKTNILTVNEDIELRGIGNVQDTLDLMTGELTQRIGEVVLNGSETWHHESVTKTYYTNLRDLGVELNPYSDIVLCDKFISYSSHPSVGGCALGGNIGSKNGNLLINYDELSGGVENFKSYLRQNPTTIQVVIKESIKTVDLTTVDQDGQPTKLKTYNDVTHVENKADNLIPSVDLEVATKISETLSTMGPQQLDISETQNKLGQTIDEQTENTDATMMATTEIYENL